MNIAEQLEINSVFVTESGCQIWIGSLRNGYGFLKINNKNFYAHRLSFEQANGKIPTKIQICHKCDTKPCINKDHLFAGTNQQNAADLSAKGKHWEQLKTHCKNGHLLQPKAVGERQRVCLLCHREADRRYRENKRFTP